MTRTREHERKKRCTADDGAALIEFTLVSILLLTLVFGIISFGLILSFKQDMTRAAAEGARAGAVASPGDALTSATAATDEAVSEFSDRFDADGCSTAGMSCTYALTDCGRTTGGDPAVPDCVTVDLSYDYDAEPFLAKMPLIEAVLPKEINASSTARVNG